MKKSITFLLVLTSTATLIGGQYSDSVGSSPKQNYSAVEQTVESTKDSNNEYSLVLNGQHSQVTTGSPKTREIGSKSTIGLDPALTAMQDEPSLRTRQHSASVTKSPKGGVLAESTPTETDLAINEI